MATGSLTTSASIATLIVVCLVFFIDIANLGMANIALPTIQHVFGFTDGDLQWVLTALFNIATIICAVTRNPIGFLVGRAFQGVTAAFTIPSAQSLVALSFDDPQSRIRAFAAWGACGSSGFVLGPIIGGLLTSLVSWDWIFWVSLIIEGALEITALALLVTNNIPGSGLHIRLDTLGTALSVPALVLLVFGLTTGNSVGWDHVEVISTIVTAGVLLGSFVFVEVKISSDPILPKYIWGDRVRILGCAAAALTYGAWQGFLPLGVTAVVVNFIVPPILKPVGARILLIGSWLLTIVGIILFTRMKSTGDYWRFCLPGMILYIAGVGTVYFVGNVTIVATASEDRQGTVSGVYNMFLNVGGAVLGVAVLTVINDSVVSNNGGKGDPNAILAGFRAGYYGAIAMSALGLLSSIFFTIPKTDIKVEVKVDGKPGQELLPERPSHSPQQGIVQESQKEKNQEH
ncbi:aminotriazole resistance protein [Astrocystis sublimbata]|nr:aminotriazole resistance protein [Astrocystis sublimbata]